MARLLLVDDDGDQLEVRRLLLEHSGHAVLSAGSAAEAMHLVDHEALELIVMDLRLPRTEDGLALIRHIRQQTPAARIVVLSGWTSDVADLPEASMIDHLMLKPVRSHQLLRLVARLAVWLLCVVPFGNAQQQNTFPFQVDAPSEVVADLDLSAPGADWGRAGRESVMAVVSVDEAAKQHVMVYAGAERRRYPIFLGEITPGVHQLKIERHPEWSARGPLLQIHGASFRSYKPADPDYVVVAHAPILFARPNTIGKFTDVPLLAYCERLGDGSLRYSVIFSNEDGGTSTRGLMARWGRVTDIEHVYQAWLDGSGKPVRAGIQTRDHKDVEFRGRRQGRHPLLGVVTDNNMVADDATSAVRYQLAPVVANLSAASREKVMDENPLTYLISARELEREGKLRTYGTVDGQKISAPENYLFAELRIQNKETRLAVLVRLTEENLWRASHLGAHDLAIERSGWVRTAIELPPATQPSQVAEIGFLCLPEPKTDGNGACRIDALGKLFFLTAAQSPGPSFWQPRMDRGPWIVAPGQMRVVSLR
ncbi:MAG: response regulator [Acidobacteria bacterium]|nr:response regulator [Acidobacteriota bacterium]